MSQADRDRNPEDSAEKGARQIPAGGINTLKLAYFIGIEVTRLGPRVTIAEEQDDLRAIVALVWVR